jgi:hypothetical protein
LRFDGKLVIVAVVAVILGGVSGGTAVYALLKRHISEQHESQTAGHHETGNATIIPANTLGLGPGDAQRTRILPDKPSFYLTHLSRSGLDVEAMTPILISPLQQEDVPTSCPDRLSVIVGEGSYASAIEPYLAAIGQVEFDKTGRDQLVKDVVLELENRWRVLRSLASGPVSQSPLRILVLHYPREALPGRCVSLMVTIYNLPDTFLDQSWFREHHPAPNELAPVRGLLFRLRKTYQLDGAQPRLIEAWAEVQTQCQLGFPPLEPQVADPIAAESLGDAWTDPEFFGHFYPFAGGQRYGLAWIDQSAGIGPARSMGRAFLSFNDEVGKKPRIQKARLPPELRDALIALVERA